MNSLERGDSPMKANQKITFRANFRKLREVGLVLLKWLKSPQENKFSNKQRMKYLIFVIK